MQGRAGNIIGPSDRKEAPFSVLPGSREHVTALPCFNACGQWIPPYFLFPGKRIPVTYNPLEGGVEGSVFSMTESGYMDTSTFYMWFANHFIPNLPPARPAVLLVDGHDSHLNLELFQLAEKNQGPTNIFYKTCPWASGMQKSLAQKDEVVVPCHRWYKCCRNYFAPFSGNK